jgi:hypothetical protein
VAKTKRPGPWIKRAALRAFKTRKPTAKDRAATLQVIPLGIDSLGDMKHLWIYRYGGQEYREEDRPAIGRITITITPERKP